MHRLVAAAALLLPFSAIHEPLSAQRVTGRVVESGSGERVSTAQVSLVDEAGTTVRTAISDTAGYFVLDARRPGTYRLRAARIGYADYTSDRIDLQAGETVTVVVRLAAQGVPLQPLEVRARGVEERGRDGFERRRALVRGVFLTVDSIRLRDPVLVSDAFYGIPGVQVFEGLGPVQVFSMHGAKCFVMFRDHWPGGIGVGTMPDLRRALPTGGQGAINTLNIEWIKGIEIYRDMSEVPMELRTAWRLADLWPAGGVASGGRWRGEPCGMIWIWTDLGW